tara:strand:- start:72 stop:308 length:237 start_codon:yes stop_codon:yes gene_type:complete
MGFTVTGNGKKKKKLKAQAATSLRNKASTRRYSKALKGQGSSGKATGASTGKMPTKSQYKTSVARPKVMDKLARKRKR